jgi:hypothetical protein
MNSGHICKLKSVLGAVLIVLALLAVWIAPPRAILADSQHVLSVGNVSGTPGASIQAPVTLTSPGDVVGIQFTLNYDSSQLSYVSASLGVLTTDNNHPFTINANGAVPGKVTVMIYSNDDVAIPAGNGSVAQFQFKVAGDLPAGQSSALTLSEVIVGNSNGQPISTNVNNGQFSQAQSGGRTITINAGKVPSVLTDFPVLISISGDSGLRTSANGGQVANDDGSDIYFSDPTGNTRYPSEIETYSGSTGSLTAWVKVPSLFDGAVININFGGSPGGAAPASVWSNGFRAVWHLNNGNATDSAGNGNNGTPVENSTSPAITAKAGQISTAVNFAPGGTYIDCGSDGSLDFLAAGSYTWETWINPAEFHSGGSGIIGKEPGKDSENNAVDYFGYDISLGGSGGGSGGGSTPGQLRFQTTGGSSTDGMVTSSVGMALNTWTHIAAVYKNGAVSLYINGILNNSGNVRTADDTSSALYLGFKRNSPTQSSLYGHLKGGIDEVEYSGVARSADWILTQYRNQSAPGDFYTLGNGSSDSAPVMVAHPASQSVSAGAGATFSAAASGSPAPTVQWQQLTAAAGDTWTNIASAVSNTLTLNPVTLDMNGFEYRAVFTNSAGTVNSNAATLTVTPASVAPTISRISPAAGPVIGGTAITITGTGFVATGLQVLISGSPAGSVHLLSDTEITGVTPPGTAGAADVTVTVAGGSVTLTAGFNYQAIVAPAVALQPSNLTRTAGNSAVFSARASGLPVPSVQWQISTDQGSVWNNIQGAGAGTLVLSNVTGSMNGYQYRAVFNNAGGQIETDSATLTIVPVPTGGRQYYRTLSVNTGRVPSVLIDFPVLVTLHNDTTLRTTAAGGHVAAPDGYDIYFTDSSGSTRYASEIESYDGLNGNLTAWVKIPSLAGGTAFRMYYGTAPAAGTASVWSNAFQGVWHLNNAALDSTANANNGIENGNSGSISNVAGQIGGAEHLAPGATFIDCGTAGNLNFKASGSYTWEAWINWDGRQSGGSGLFTQKTNPSLDQQGYSIYIAGGGGGSGGGSGGTGYSGSGTSGQIRIQSSAANSYSVGAYDSGPETAQWQHLAVTYQNSKVKMYVNGQLIQVYSVVNSQSQSPASSGTLQTSDSASTDHFIIGWNLNAPASSDVYSHFNGSLDELRFSNALRSPDWIQTEYNNQSAPGNFYNISSETLVQSSSGGGGGGGGGSSGTSVKVVTSGFAGNDSFTVSSQGYTQNAVRLVTADGKISLDIPANTRLLNSSMGVLSTLAVSNLTSPPAPPSGSAIITACTFGPDGARFSPAIKLSLTYDPTGLPAGVDENSLQITYFDGTQWQGLDSQLSVQNHLVTVQITHFSDYALMGKVSVADSTQTTTPSNTPSQTSEPVVTSPGATTTTLPAGSPSSTVSTTSPTGVATPSSSRPTSSVSAPTSNSGPVSTTGGSDKTTEPAQQTAFSKITWIVPVVLGIVAVLVLAIIVIRRRQRNKK